MSSPTPERARQPEPGDRQAPARRSRRAPPGPAGVPGRTSRRSSAPSSAPGGERGVERARRSAAPPPYTCSASAGNSARGIAKIIAMRSTTKVEQQDRPGAQEAQPLHHARQPGLAAAAARGGIDAAASATAQTPRRTSGRPAPYAARSRRGRRAAPASSGPTVDADAELDLPQRVGRGQQRAAAAAAGMKACRAGLSSANSPDCRATTAYSSQVCAQADARACAEQDGRRAPPARSS